VSEISLNAAGSAVSSSSLLVDDGIFNSDIAVDDGGISNSDISVDGGDDDNDDEIAILVFSQRSVV